MFIFNLNLSQVLRKIWGWIKMCILFLYLLRPTLNNIFKNVTSVIWLSFHPLISASMGNCAERGQFGVKCWCISCCVYSLRVCTRGWLFVFHQNPATLSQLQKLKGSSFPARLQAESFVLFTFLFQGKALGQLGAFNHLANTSVNLPYPHNHAAITALKNFSRLQFAFLIRSIYMQMRLCGIHHCNAVFYLIQMWTTTHHYSKDGSPLKTGLVFLLFPKYNNRSWGLEGQTKLMAFKINSLLGEKVCWGFKRTWNARPHHSIVYTISQKIEAVSGMTCVCALIFVKWFTHHHLFNVAT